jgi:hypothetical protein
MDGWTAVSRALGKRRSRGTLLRRRLQFDALETRLAPASGSMAIEPVVSAGEDGPRTVTVTLFLAAGDTLSNAVTAEVVDAGGGSAASGIDHDIFATQAVVFAAGSVDGATQTVSLTPVDDALVEGDETVNLLLQNVDADFDEIAISGSSSIVTIEDDDFADVSIDPYPFFFEGGGAQTIAVVLEALPDVTLAADVSVDVVDLLTGSGSSGSDYAVFGTQTVTFSAGSGAGATQFITLVVQDDALLEGVESVELSLQKLSTTLDGQVGLCGCFVSSVVAIVDDDMPLPDFEGAAAMVDIEAVTTVTETGGARSIIVTLTMSPGALLMAELSVDVVDAGGGSAVSGVDYAAFGVQTVTFAAGSTNGATRTVTLTPIDDAALEGNETVNLTLQNLSTNFEGRVSLGSTSSLVTIADNDTAPPAVVPPAAAPPSPLIIEMSFRDFERVVVTGLDPFAMTGRLALGATGATGFVTLTISNPRLLFPVDVIAPLAADGSFVANFPLAKVRNSLLLADIFRIVRADRKHELTPPMRELLAQIVTLGSRARDGGNWARQVRLLQQLAGMHVRFANLLAQVNYLVAQYSVRLVYSGDANVPPVDDAGTISVVYRADRIYKALPSRMIHRAIVVRALDRAGANLSSPLLQVTAVGLVGPDSQRIALRSPGTVNKDGKFYYDKKHRASVYMLDSRSLKPGYYYFYYRLGRSPRVQALSFWVGVPTAGA